MPALVFFVVVFLIALTVWAAFVAVSIAAATYWQQIAPFACLVLAGALAGFLMKKPSPRERRR